MLTRCPIQVGQHILSLKMMKKWHTFTNLIKLVLTLISIKPLSASKPTLHDIQLEIGILELQLLEIYNDIEVSNLALLQQSQEIEGTLESLKTKIREARATNDAEINSLESQLAVS